MGGMEADGGWVEAQHMIDGAPSVLFDAIALLTSAAGPKVLSLRPQPAISLPTLSSAANSSVTINLPCRF